MFPRFPIRNVAYVLMDNPKLFCNLVCSKFSRFPEGFYFPNIILSQLRIGDCFSFRLSSFFNFIFSVIKARSNEEVFRVYARRVVAFVKDIKAIFDFAEMNLPRYPMGIRIFRVSSNNTISFWNSRAIPNPAIGSFIDKFPKTDFQRIFSIFISTWPTSWSFCLFSRTTINTFPEMVAFATVWINVKRCVKISMFHMASDIIAQKDIIYGI